MTYQEILDRSRDLIGPYCKSCKICNGQACKNTIPGPGAKGLGTGAIRNYQKWQELCVNMDTICENGDVDTSYDFFGHKLAIPVMAGPVGAVTLHYSDKHDDLSYNNVLVEGCANAGIIAFTGDGTNPAVMEATAEALRANGGCGVPTVKPWNLETVRQKMDLVKAAEHRCRSVATYLHAEPVCNVVGLYEVHCLVDVHLCRFIAREVYLRRYEIRVGLMAAAFECRSLPSVCVCYHPDVAVVKRVVHVFDCEATLALGEIV